MKMFFAVLAFIVVIPFANAQRMSSSDVCSAYTDCVDNYGRTISRISCQVYGYEYLQGYGASANQSCNWFVQPYVSVSCNGYQQMQNSYGQTFWQWQTYNMRCPGR